MSQIDEIKNRLDIAEIISGYLQLKPAGANFRACCPFHQEKTPSFMVSREKQIWHCFGCGLGGNVFDFVMRMEGLEFKDALKILADKAGIMLERYDSALLTQRERLLKINESAANFFHEFLLKSPLAEEPRAYLRGRGLTDEIIEDFKLGFSPAGWDLLLNFLKKQGFRENDILSAGLIIKKTSGTGFFDRFRTRVMIPIVDVNGRIIGFTGRLLPSEEKKTNAGGKYMNTPQTLVYDKSNVLYCLNKAKQDIKKEDGVIIVEGNMDAITCHQFGFKNVVASSGTALTIDQIKLLKRFTRNLFLSFDADLAGEAAAKRGVDNAFFEEMNVKIIQIPNGFGKDPDECVRKNMEVWKSAVKNAKDIMEYYFEKTFAGKDINKLDDQRKIKNTLLPEIHKLLDGVSKNFWRKKLAENLNIKEEVLYDEEKKIKNAGKTYQTKENTQIIPQKRTREELLAERMLAALLVNPFNLNETAKVILPENFPQSHSFLYKNFILCYNSKGTLDYQTIKDFLAGQDINEDAKKNFYSIAMVSERDFKSLGFKLLKEEFNKIILELKLMVIAKKRKGLEEEIKKAERAGNVLAAKEFSREFKELI